MFFYLNTENVIFRNLQVCLWGDRLKITVFSTGAPLIPF
jgi:hypothetical protein